MVVLKIVLFCFSVFYTFYLAITYFCIIRSSKMFFKTKPTKPTIDRRIFQRLRITYISYMYTIFSVSTHPLMDIYFHILTFLNNAKQAFYIFDGYK